MGRGYRTRDHGGPARAASAPGPRPRRNVPSPTCPARMGYAPAMPFAPADLAALEAAEEIEIETRAAADAPVHRTIIWVVTDGADAFVR